MKDVLLILCCVSFTWALKEELEEFQKKQEKYSNFGRDRLVVLTPAEEHVQLVANPVVTLVQPEPVVVAPVVQPIVDVVVPQPQYIPTYHRQPTRQYQPLQRRRPQRLSDQLLSPSLTQLPREYQQDFATYQQKLRSKITLNTEVPYSTPPKPTIPHISETTRKVLKQAKDVLISSQIARKQDQPKHVSSISKAVLDSNIDVKPGMISGSLIPDKKPSPIKSTPKISRAPSAKSAAALPANPEPVQIEIDAATVPVSKKIEATATLPKEHIIYDVKVNFEESSVPKSVKAEPTYRTSETLPAPQSPTMYTHDRKPIQAPPMPYQRPNPATLPKYTSQQEPSVLTPYQQSSDLLPPLPSTGYSQPDPHIPYSKPDVSSSPYIPTSYSSQTETKPVAIKNEHTVAALASPEVQHLEQHFNVENSKISQEEVERQRLFDLERERLKALQKALEVAAFEHEQRRFRLERQREHRRVLIQRERQRLKELKDHRRLHLQAEEQRRKDLKIAVERTKQLQKEVERLRALEEAQENLAKEEMKQYEIEEQQLRQKEIEEKMLIGLEVEEQIQQEAEIEQQEAEARQAVAAKKSQVNSSRVSITGQILEDIIKARRKAFASRSKT